MTDDRPEVARVSLRLPAQISKDVDALVDEGEYLSRSDAIRDALKRLVEYHRELYALEGELVMDEDSDDDDDDEDDGDDAIDLSHL